MEPDPGAQGSEVPEPDGRPVEADGPFDATDLDLEQTDAVGRLDFDSLRVPMPEGARLQVEKLSDGRLKAVHVLVALGRLSVSALAAPKTGKLWPELASEIAASLQNDGARVRIEPGTWGREVVAGAGEAQSRFIGVDGERWMLYGISTGPTTDAAEAADILRDMIRGTIVVRGTQPYPVRTILPLSIPPHLQPLLEQLEEANEQLTQVADPGAPASAAPAAAYPAAPQVPAPARPTQLPPAAGPVPPPAGPPRALPPMRPPVGPPPDRRPVVPVARRPDLASPQPRGLIPPPVPPPVPPQALPPPARQRPTVGLPPDAFPPASIPPQPIPPQPIPGRSIPPQPTPAQPLPPDRAGQSPPLPDARPSIMGESTLDDLLSPRPRPLRGRQHGVTGPVPEPSGELLTPLNPLAPLGWPDAAEPAAPPTDLPTPPAWPAVGAQPAWPVDRAQPAWPVDRAQPAWPEVGAEPANEAAHADVAWDPPTPPAWPSLDPPPPRPWNAAPPAFPDRLGEPGWAAERDRDPETSQQPALLSMDVPDFTRQAPDGHVPGRQFSGGQVPGEQVPGEQVPGEQIPDGGVSIGDVRPVDLSWEEPAPGDASRGRHRAGSPDSGRHHRD